MSAKAGADGSTSEGLFDALVVRIYGMFLPSATGRNIPYSARRAQVDKLCRLASAQVGGGRVGGKNNFGGKFDGLLDATGALVGAAKRRGGDEMAFAQKFREVLQPQIDVHVFTFVCDVCGFGGAARQRLRACFNFRRDGNMMTRADDGGVGERRSRGGLDTARAIVHMFDPFSALQGMVVWQDLLASILAGRADWSPENSADIIKRAAFSIRTALVVHWFCREALLQSYGYSVPSETALAWIKSQSYKTIVSFGSGEGYWEHCMSTWSAADKSGTGQAKAPVVICFDLKDDLRVPFCSNYHQILPDTLPKSVWARAGMADASSTALFLSWVPNDSDSVAFERCVRSFAGPDVILVGDASACGGIGFLGSLEDAGFSEMVVEEALPNFLGWKDCMRVFRRKSDRTPVEMTGMADSTRIASASESKTATGGSKIVIGLVSNYEMVIKGREYSAEDRRLKDELERRGFVVDLTLPELLLPLPDIIVAAPLNHNIIRQNETLGSTSVNSSLLHKLDIVFFRNNYGGEKDGLYRNALRDFLQNEQPRLTRKVFNTFGRCKGDYRGKQHLLDLFQDGFPTIPSTIDINDLEKTPFCSAPSFMVKSMSGADSNGMFPGLTMQDAREKMLSLAVDGAAPSYLIQPMVDFVCEVSFVYLNGVFMYAMSTNGGNNDGASDGSGDETTKRWALTVYDPTEADLEFAQKFVDWNDCGRQIQRIDACRATATGSLLLMELEDYCCWLSLAELAEQRPELLESFVNALALSLREYYHSLQESQCRVAEAMSNYSLIV